MGIIEEIGILVKERDLWKSKYYKLISSISTEIKINPISGEELTEYFSGVRIAVQRCADVNK